MAVCRKCARITSQLERYISREIMLAARAQIGYRSRHKDQLPLEFDLNVTDKAGRDSVLSLPIDEDPGFVVFPMFERPQMLIDRTHRQGIAVNGTRLLALGAGTSDLVNEHQLSQIRYSISIRATEYARFLAKWAFCEAVFHYGLDRFESVYVREDILGETDTIGTFVGCDGLAQFPFQPGINTVQFLESPDGEVLAREKMFPLLPTPEYLVVLGRLKEGR